MNREIHKIFDKILKMILMSYSRDFLKYIGEKKSISRILHTEFTTKKGRTLLLDFLCELEDGTLLNIEFQFTGPDEYDLDRFHDYNIFSQTKYDSLCETIIINFRTHKSRQKTRKIGQSKSIHPQIIYLGDTDFEKILNSIENKAKNNLKLTNNEEISLMLMCLLPKYKNKNKLLERICKIHEKEFIFDKRKMDTFKAVITLEIENLLEKDESEKLKGELNMTPEAEEMLTKAFEEVERKHMLLEIEEASRKAFKKGEKKGKKEGIKEGIKKGIIEGKKEGIKENTKEIAKKLKGKLPPEEIANITGLTLTTVLKL